METAAKKNSQNNCISALVGEGKHSEAGKKSPITLSKVLKKDSFKKDFELPFERDNCTQWNRCTF
ncbi:MAG: hypothetical protein B7Y39_09720 [Bdellovibrio sp. 28-41-41]|nr:MAG: hypothetical protein B7Y39_09720 [Bdellovibrio sp. 28-41-41]